MKFINQKNVLIEDLNSITREGTCINSFKDVMGQIALKKLKTPNWYSQAALDFDGDVLNIHNVFAATMQSGVKLRLKPFTLIDHEMELQHLKTLEYSEYFYGIEFNDLLPCTKNLLKIYLN